jgi:murein DD-endopeptidase MepM/ murein hydrolase activator NlpD
VTPVLEYPIKNPEISQPFGVDNSNHPDKKKFYELFDNKHPGVDFSIQTGTNVYASFPGIIVRREIHKGMGKIIATRNGNIICLYAHLNKFRGKLGQIIKTGELIGISGNSGTATTEPHLHFEIREITKPVLKKMVFDPPFGQQFDNYKKEFVYKINNTNTKKTFGKLAKLYFGNEKYWKSLVKANPRIKAQKNDLLTHGVEILIPNYA